MSNMYKLLALLTALLAVWVISGCGEAEKAAEEALEEETGFAWELGEEDFVDKNGIQTPDNWQFLFAVDLDKDQAELLEEDFDVDLSIIEDLGFELPEIEFQIVFAKADTTPSGEPGLRYANKVLIQDGKITMDSESLELLGSSVGPTGAGWYACYLALESFGYIKGTVKDCDGNAPAQDDILVAASDGPFFTFAATDGSWALPSLGGKPATISFDAGDCSGSDSEPVTDTEDDPNGKEPGTEPPSDDFTDEQSTDVVDGGETNLGDEGNETPPAGDDLNLDFESGTTGWEGPADCFLAIPDDYATLFPEGDQANYAFITTGGNGRQSCTVTRTLMVPEGVSKLVVSYDYVSQEYAEWVNSAYNDMFTIILQGETSYLVNRTINDIAADGAWIDYGTAIGNIVDSADATYNPPGPPDGLVFDGQINPDEINGEDVPRGGNDDTKVYGRTAKYDVTPGATITIIITVADVADAIYDSAALIDYFAFE